jgi:hypothetical protein
MVGHLRRAYETGKPFCRPGWSRIAEQSILFNLISGLASADEGRVDIDNLCSCQATKVGELYVIKIVFYDRKIDCLIELYRNMEECKSSRALSDKMEKWQKDIATEVTRRFTRIAEELIDEIQETV